MTAFRLGFAATAALCVAAALALATSPDRSSAQDLDGDGWSVANGDCADVVGVLTTRPWLVNPGAYDIPGNGIDDDCDGTIDNPGPTTCSASADLSPSAVGLAQAMDLCQTTVPHPILIQKVWGLISASSTLLRASGSGVPSTLQVGVKTKFGTNIMPQANATMAVISSGTARDASDPGWVNPTPGYSSGTAAVSAPADFTGPNGGLYHSAGCPVPGDPAFDSVRLKLVIRVPTNAIGFKFRHRFFSSDYPLTCSAFNDHMLALLTSTAPGVPANKNIMFDNQSNPVTTQTAHFTECSGCSGGTNGLAGTGYSTTDDAATAWATASAPVTPGEDITLEFHIWDSSDALGDALGLIDDFEWTFDPEALGVDAAIPTRVDLSVGPNPFASSATVRLTLPRTAHVSADVLDAGGRRVRSLARRHFTAGTAQLTWDGAGDDGQAVRPGVYFVRVTTGGSHTTCPVVRLR